MIVNGRDILARAMPRSDTLYIESDVKEFISRLPEPKIDPPEVFLAMLAVRSKKAKEFLGVKIRDLVVEREIIRPSEIWRKRYLSKIHNLAVLQHHGLYDMKETIEFPRIPPEAMGIMATISPRNVYFAITDLMSENIKYLYEHSMLSSMELAKENSRFFGFLHKHKQKGYNFVTLDIDSMDGAIFKHALDVASSFPKFMVTETSGGWHIVLDLKDSQSAKDFYIGGGVWDTLVTKYPCIELQRDSQEPICGTLYHRRGSTEPFFVRFVE
jgi:hypothetical protein